MTFCESCKVDEGCITNCIGRKTVQIGMSDGLSLEAWMLYGGRDESPVIHVALTDGSSPVDCESFRIPIKYCPTCGRKII